MSAIDKATPRPWAVEDAKAASLIRDSQGFMIASTHDDARIGGGPNRETRLANAALIVRAVNRDHLFDEMVDALEEIAREAPEAEPIDPGATGNYGDSRDYSGDLTHWHLGNIARAVLAKAKAVLP